MAPQKPSCARARACNARARGVEGSHENSHAHDRLLIIDFGSQVTQLIARRLRELNVYCEIHPFQNVTEAFPGRFRPEGGDPVGRPGQRSRRRQPAPARAVFELGVPVLGICYGQQVMMQMLGGRVERGDGTAEFGRAYVVPHRDHRADLLTGWFATGREQVWMSHGDHVSEIAPGFEVYGTSPGAPSPSPPTRRHFYAVQFHPEVHHTPNGARFTRTSCASPGSPATGPWAPTATRRSPGSARRWATPR